MSERFFDSFFLVAPYLPWREQLGMAAVCKTVRDMLPQALVTLEITFGTLRGARITDLVAKYWRLDKLVVHNSAILSGSDHFEDLVRALEAKPMQLTVFKFESCEYDTDTALDRLMTALSNLPRLESLTILGKNEPQSSLNAFLSLRRVVSPDNFLQLKVLNFSHNRTEKVEARLISEITQSKPHLMELSLQGMAMGSELALFEPMLSNMRNLSVLSVSSNGLLLEGALVLQRILTQDRSALTELNISSNWLTAAGAQALKFALPQLPALRVLDVSRNKLGENEGLVLAECISLCRNLEVFKSSDNLLKSSVVTLISSMADLPALNKLDFSVNSIGPENSRQFAARLPLMHSLKCLNINQNRLGYGFYDIAAVLGQASLTRLDAQSNQIEDFGLLKLADNLGTLQYVNLSMNAVSFTAIESFLIKAQSSRLQTLNLKLQSAIKTSFEREKLKTLIPEQSHILTRL